MSISQYKIFILTLYFQNFSFIFRSYYYISFKKHALEKKNYEYSFIIIDGTESKRFLKLSTFFWKSVWKSFKHSKISFYISFLTKKKSGALA